MLVGVVGKPSVGKSTFFKAATLSEAEIANYPFTTIKPNHGVGYVEIECADKFFNVQCNPRFGFCIHHKRFVSVDMLDVAGLVPGAHEGKGMGNQFLDDLRQADVLVHVVDVAGATNERGEEIPPGTYDPANDVKFLVEELDYWYLGILKKGWEKFARDIQQTHKEVNKALGKQLSGLGVDEKMCEVAMKELNLDPVTVTAWSESDLFKLAQYFRKKTKPLVIACNKIDLSSGEQNYKRLKAQFPHEIIIPCSAESELALREAAKKGLIEYVPGERDFKILKENDLTDKQKKALEYIKENILKKYEEGSGVQQTLNKAVLNLLGYIAIFPGGVNKLADSNGNILPDCFLMPPKSTALDFAFKLHTDFGKYFIRAINVKTKMPVGKDHPLNNGDVIEIVSGK